MSSQSISFCYYLLCNMNKFVFLVIHLLTIYSVVCVVSVLFIFHYDYQHRFVKRKCPPINIFIE